MGINYSIAGDINIEDEHINEDITEISYEEGVRITRKDMEFNPILETIDEESDHESNTIVYPIIENNMNAITEKSNDFINQSLSGLSSNYDDFTLKQKELSDCPCLLAEPNYWL